MSSSSRRSYVLIVGVLWDQRHRPLLVPRQFRGNWSPRLSLLRPWRTSGWYFKVLRAM